MDRAKEQRELDMLNMADWFQAAIGLSFRVFGQGHYKWEAECRRVEGAEGGASYDRRHGGYSFRVKEPNKTEILHGPMHTIRTTARASHTAVLCAKRPSGLMMEVKRDAFEKHAISCANSILFSKGADHMITREEPCWESDGCGDHHILDASGNLIPLMDENGLQVMSTYTEHIRNGSGLVERLGSAPFRWGMDAKWRLRFYRENDLLRYTGNTQRPDDDCVACQWASRFRVEIMEPQKGQYWKGWEESLEWKDHGKV